MIINKYIISALADGWNDCPEQILETFNISMDGLTEDEIFDKSEEVLQQYITLGEELLYTDLEKCYQKKLLYFQYDNKAYGVEYYDGPYGGIQIDGNPFEVECYIETIQITKYRPKNETN